MHTYAYICIYILPCTYTYFHAHAYATDYTQRPLLGNKGGSTNSEADNSHTPSEGGTPRSNSSYQHTKTRYSESEQQSPLMPSRPPVYSTLHNGEARVAFPLGQHSPQYMQHTSTGMHSSPIHPPFISEVNSRQQQQQQQHVPGRAGGDHTPPRPTQSARSDSWSPRRVHFEHGVEEASPMRVHFEQDALGSPKSAPHSQPETPSSSPRARVTRHAALPSSPGLTTSPSKPPLPRPPIAGSTWGRHADSRSAPALSLSLGRETDQERVVKADRGSTYGVLQRMNTSTSDLEAEDLVAKVLKVRQESERSSLQAHNLQTNGIYAVTYGEHNSSPLVAPRQHLHSDGQKSGQISSRHGQFTSSGQLDGQRSTSYGQMTAQRAISFGQTDGMFRVVKETEL